MAPNSCFPFLPQTLVPLPGSQKVQQTSTWMAAHQQKLNDDRQDGDVVNDSMSRSCDLPGEPMDHTFWQRGRSVARSVPFHLGIGLLQLAPWGSSPVCHPPLHLIQNADARLVFNLHKFSQTKPLKRSLHKFPGAARIRFKTQMLGYKSKNRPAPTYLKTLFKHRSAPCSIWASRTARLYPPPPRRYTRDMRRDFSMAWQPGSGMNFPWVTDCWRLKIHLFTKYLNMSTNLKTGLNMVLLMYQLSSLTGF